MNNNVEGVSSSNQTTISLEETMKRKNESSSDKAAGNNKRRRKDLICVICHGAASGYNFAQISCSSCKEFFRRTALLPIDRMKCNNKNHRTNEIHCEIRFDMKQKCQRCRLLKCFQTGMRKDHLITPEEKLSRQKHMETNRRIRSGETTATETRSSSTVILTDADRARLSNVANAYLSALQSNPSASSMISFNPSFHTTFSYLHLIEIEKFAPIKLICFLRSIPEFQSLVEEDRLSLVKYNFFPLFVLRDVLVYNPQNRLLYDDGVQSTSRSTLDDRFAYNYTSLCILFYGYDCIHGYFSWMDKMQNIVDNDTLLIQLMMLVMIFLKGAAINSEQVWTLVDSRSVFHAHLKYVDLLFRYLIERYTFDRAVIKMLRLVENIFELQTHARFYQNKLLNEGGALIIHPLMRVLIGFHDP